MTSQGTPERLRAARAAAGLTQEQVGRALGVSAQTIANWEHGRTSPSTADVARLAALYRVSCDWLLTGKPRLAHRFEPPVAFGIVHAPGCDANPCTCGKVASA